ncbi:hypothetical protein ABZ470_18415 [Streptosporangium sp. NPDC020072]|uniref:hypothetical protein n=1 Tax=Streptosporangium sp. NPDC020072 TaxID=3154788 RepID=UPI00342B1529
MQLQETVGSPAEGRWRSPRRPASVRRSVHAAAARVRGLAFTAFADQRISPFTGVALLLFARLVFTLGVLALFAFTALTISLLLLFTGRFVSW